ncbi:MAG: nitroreductase family protein [Calditrichota bacterium]
MAGSKFVPLTTFQEYPVEEMQKRALEFYEMIRRRRSVREFSDRDVPRDIIENCLLAGGTAPNGANRQPWHFVAIKSAEVKREIRIAAEAEEKEFYQNRAPQDWLDVLQPLGTDENKPFLEIAPWLITIFAEAYALEEGERVKNYYVPESVGIATGMLITALHNAGLATLTHTPSPMKFLNSILNRPTQERPFLILVVGYPEEGCQVPDITKKPLSDIATFME